jgi:hypothetical protein
MPSREYSNRYTDFNINGVQTVVPYITLPSKNSDKKYIYKLGQSRLDKVSEQYYGTPYYGWLIMLANPSFGGQEWNIIDGSILTIPYPLVASLQDYKNALENHFFYYGR